ELEIGTVDTVALLELCDDVGALLEDKLVEPSRVLHVVAAPVVGELEAGEVPGAVVELAHASESFVAVATHAKRTQNVEIRLRLERKPEELHPDAIQRGDRLHAVAELVEWTALGHGERHEPRAVRPARVGVRAGEGSPDYSPALPIHELRATD